MNFGTLLTHPGTVDASEAHLWANAGKGLCCWLLWKHADAIIQHWEFALVLFSALIIPKTFERIALAKFNVPVNSP